jgi:hypothetical protein
MIREISSLAKYALGKDLAGRNFTVFPDDTFLVSYPRSGSTWSRFLLAGLLHPEVEPTFANIDELLPAVSSQSKRGLKNLTRPRVLKSHEYFDPRYPKVIYIVRDPRDVLLSQYRFFLKCRRIEDGYPMKRFTESFLRGDLNEYGSWGEHAATWIAARRDSKDFLLIRYEEMVQQTELELAKISRFLGWNCSSEQVARAVRLSSAGRLRELESSQGDEWIVTRGRRKDIPFIGPARSGRWKADLPLDCLAAIEGSWGPLMSYFRYELTSSPVQRMEVSRQGLPFYQPPLEASAAIR